MSRESVQSMLSRWFFQRSVAGSPSYIAPEVIRRKIPGKAADLYSLGVVAYFALTGKLPFSGSGAQEILRRQKSSTPMAPSTAAW